MISTRAFQWMARAIATAWRWPPESARTGWSRRRISMSSVSMVRSAAARIAARSMRGRKPSQRAARLAAEEDVGADVEIVGQRQVLVDRLDAAVAGLRGLAKLDPLAGEADLAADPAGRRRRSA
jgi:hypothetical protein